MGCNLLKAQTNGLNGGVFAPFYPSGIITNVAIITTNSAPPITNLAGITNNIAYIPVTLTQANPTGSAILLTNVPPQFSYSSLFARSPLDLSGPNMDVMAGTWGDRTGGYTNGEYLTNTILFYYTNGFASSGCRFIRGQDGDCSGRDTNGNLTFSTNIFTNGFPSFCQFAATNGGMVYGVYLCAGTNTAGGNQGSDVQHIYRDTLNICSNHAGIRFESDGSFVGSNTVLTSIYNQQFFSLMNQAISDYNYNASSNLQQMWIPPIDITGLATPVQYASANGQYTIVSPYTYSIASSITVNSCPTNVSAGVFAGDLYQTLFALGQGNFTGLGHYTSTFPILNTFNSTETTNQITFLRMTCSPIYFRFGYQGDPTYANFIGNGGNNITNQFMQPNFLGTYKSGNSMQYAKQVYSNNWTWVFNQQIGIDCQNPQLVYLINSNSMASNFVVNVKQIGLASNTMYGMSENYTRGSGSNFQNSFIFTVAPLSVNMLMVSNLSTLTLSTTPFSPVTTNYAVSGLFSSNNLFLGINAGYSVTKAVGNVIIGHGAGSNITDAGNSGGGAGLSVIIGYNAAAFGNNANNVMIGQGAGQGSQANGNSGSSVYIGAEAGALGQNASYNNTAIGDYCLANLLTGNSDIAISGYGGGNNWTSSETGNIAIGNSGVTGDNNITRIGTSQTIAYIAGTLNITNEMLYGKVTNSTAQIGNSGTWNTNGPYTNGTQANIMGFAFSLTSSSGGAEGVSIFHTNAFDGTIITNLYGSAGLTALTQVTTNMWKDIVYSNDTIGWAPSAGTFTVLSSWKRPLH